MQREIKFRAWDSLSPKMYTGHSLTVAANGSFHFLECDGNWIEFDNQDRIKIMLFTGKKDKNGKDIYEGDIFGNEMLRCVVKQEEDGRWMLHFVDKRIKPISILDQKISKSRVVGNIYENPELIKE